MKLKGSNLVANNPGAVYDGIINCGNLLKVLASFLQPQWDVCPEFQIEISWILTNIASGNSQQTSAVVRTVYALDMMVRLIKTSTNREVVTQCIWCLGNICAESDVYRNIVCLDNECLHYLVGVVDASLKVENYIPNKSKILGEDRIEALTSNFEIIRVGTSTLSCVCKREPSDVSKLS